LAAKQRHEVKRKLRRLWEAGSVEHRCLESVQEAGDYLDIFLELFPMSREDKADFMTPQMESFFRHIAKAMDGVGMLRFGIIEIDRQPAAMTMGFDYNDTHYLYNSAYDPRFNYLSVGVLCKVLCLKESIEKGKKKWDFLKGGETYKYHLGGREVPLYSCQIIIR
jgi:CelD/BcsL family acetyltransferase involved in cellulose biosynthesis